MKFALIDNKSAEATKGAKGICPFCNSELVAKCGDIKASHWAHKSMRNCDPWWENETEWHRSWKDNFPTDWQEIILTDELTGEKHIADVRTDYGYVIEFQHSHIEPKERTQREDFYKKVIWVVDGARLKRDFPRFLRAKEGFRLTKTKGYYLLDFPDKCFPSAWIDSSVPVFFDFKDAKQVHDPEGWRNMLYCLLPQKINQSTSLVMIISRDLFITRITTGELFGQVPEPRKQEIRQSATNPQVAVARQSEYILHKGKFIRRRRF